MTGVPVAEVKMWAMDRYHIGHAVACVRDWYVLTICGSLANFDQTPKLPKRICRKCRTRLRKAWHLEAKSSETRGV